MREGGEHVAIVESDMGWVGLWHLLRGAELLDGPEGDDVDFVPDIAADEL